SRVRAEARTPHPREPRHRVDRLLELDSAARHAALHLDPVLSVDRRAVRLGQMREDVRDVFLDVGELLAVETDHLERRLAAAPEEAPVREAQQVVAADALDRLARAAPLVRLLGVLP